MRELLEYFLALGDDGRGLDTYERCGAPELTRLHCSTAQWSGELVVLTAAAHDPRRRTHDLRGRDVLRSGHGSARFLGVDRERSRVAVLCRKRSRPAAVARVGLEVFLRAHAGLLPPTRRPASNSSSELFPVPDQAAMAPPTASTSNLRLTALSAPAPGDDNEFISFRASMRLPIAPIWGSDGRSGGGESGSGGMEGVREVLAGWVMR